ncbi:MAG TPA: sigma-70 family RNA polymerase sigma factor [Thermoguttaceae bacterium]|nr:sigma-70 family RNA polymerase sigma factor [Thermoguttaceae bacterium]
MADERTRTDVTRLVTDHHRAVYAYAYRLTGSVADAEDLSQEVFLAAQQKLGQLRKIESARSWLFTILRNCFLKLRQRQRPVPAANLQLNIDSIPAEVPEEPEIDQQRLQEAVNQLSDSFRVVLVMFYFEECSYREIAERLDLPIGTVMSRLARAKGHLRSMLFEPDARSAKTQQPSVAGE